jgi:hypothetical protein
MRRSHQQQRPADEEAEHPPTLSGETKGERHNQQTRNSRLEMTKEENIEKNKRTMRQLLLDN